jgi:hypothetical protein
MRFTAAIINPRFNVYEGHGLLLGHWNENDKNTFYFLTCAHVVFDLRAYLPYDPFYVRKGLMDIAVVKVRLDALGARNCPPPPPFTRKAST